MLTFERSRLHDHQRRRHGHIESVSESVSADPDQIGSRFSADWEQIRCRFGVYRVQIWCRFRLTPRRPTCVCHGTPSRYGEETALVKPMQSLGRHPLNLRIDPLGMQGLCIDPSASSVSLKDVAERQQFTHQRRATRRILDEHWTSHIISGAVDSRQHRTRTVGGTQASALTREHFHSTTPPIMARCRASRWKTAIHAPTQSKMSHSESIIQQPALSSDTH